MLDSIREKYKNNVLEENDLALAILLVQQVADHELAGTHLFIVI